MKQFLMKFFGSIIFLFSIFIFFVGYETALEVPIMILGTLIMIAGVVMFLMSSDKAYNESVSSVRKMSNSRNISINDFYQAFKDQDTTLGTPWLGKITTIKHKCLIFGPTEEGSILYLHKMLGSFYLSESTAGWIAGPDEELWRLNPREKNPNFLSDEDIISYSFLAHSALDDIFVVLQEFCQTGRITNFNSNSTAGKIYRFDEDFKLSGQAFYLRDFDGNPIYEIEATYPLKTFHLRDLRTGEEILKITKRLLHMTDHYDFYLNGKPYASFKQKVNLMFDQFLMDTPDGKFEMKSINDKVGINYTVKRNGTIIATIADRFNFTAHNIVFDNFVLQVREEKYLPLITAFAAMAAREARRDQSQN